MSTITPIGGPARTTLRKPTPRSKERELQLLVMSILGADETEVQYESKPSRLKPTKVRTFDLYLPRYGVYLERTEADTYAVHRSPQRRIKAAQALARKYNNAAAHMRLHPGEKVIIVTNALMEQLQADPRLLQGWLETTSTRRVA